VIENLFNIQKS